MKKILFYFNIALAVFFLSTFVAQNTQLESGFKAVQQGHVFHYYQSHNEKLLLDACLEDISDDDLNNSEKKKVSAKKTSNYNLSFITFNFSDNYLKTILSTQLFSSFSTPLYIFIGVLRL